MGPPLKHPLSCQDSNEEYIGTSVEKPPSTTSPVKDSAERLSERLPSGTTDSVYPSAECPSKSLPSTTKPLLFTDLLDPAQRLYISDSYMTSEMYLSFYTNIRGTMNRQLQMLRCLNDLQKRLLEIDPGCPGPIAEESHMALQQELQGDMTLWKREIWTIISAQGWLDPNISKHRPLTNLRYLIPNFLPTRTCLYALQNNLKLKMHESLTKGLLREGRIMGALRRITRAFCRKILLM